MQKLILFILCIFLFGSANSIAQPPYSGGGNGSDTLPYIINDIRDLNDFARDVNNGLTTAGLHFKLDSNFDNSASPFDSIIGDDGRNYFQGRFHGNGKTIHLNITQPYTNNRKYVGLFSKIEGYIDSLVIAGEVTGGDETQYLGGICGYHLEGSIRNSTNRAKITG